jgi:hypothetical protein
MRWFYDLTIRTKIIAPFSAITTLAFIAGRIGIPILAACAIFLGPAAGILVAGSLRKPLQLIATAAEKAAAGETVPVAFSRPQRGRSDSLRRNGVDGNRSFWVTG